MAALVAIFFVGGCRQPQVLPAANQRVVHYQNHIYPEARQKVASGDILVRQGTDLTSLLFAQLNPGNCPYSHCGIASIENDSAWVYHTIGGEFNPGQKMKREPLHNFAAPSVSRALGIFSPGLTPGQTKSLLNRVKAQYSAGLRFDMNFDLATDHEQYCTEMVAKNISSATGDTSWLGVVQSGGYRFIPVAGILRHNMVKEKINFQY